MTNAPNGPFSSGQDIALDVAPNSFTAGAGLVIEECSAPGGVQPTSPSQCDAKTAQSRSFFANSDGSASYQNYPVFSLPDIASLGESPTGIPVCNLANECVFYIGTGPTNFSLSHVFSLPCYANPGDGTDNGANPGNGTPEAPYVVLFPVLAVGVIGGDMWIRRRRGFNRTTSSEREMPGDWISNGCLTHQAPRPFGFPTQHVHICYTHIAVRTLGIY